MATTPEAARPIDPATVRKIGVTFRFFLFAVLARWLIGIASLLVPQLQGVALIVVNLSLLLVLLAATLTQAACAFMLARALDKHVAMQIFLSLLVVVPCLDLLGLAWLNSDAKTALERLGVKVGFFGPSTKDLPR
jgi:hypothetical protein